MIPTLVHSLNTSSPPTQSCCLVLPSAPLSTFLALHHSDPQTWLPFEGISSISNIISKKNGGTARAVARANSSRRCRRCRSFCRHRRSLTFTNNIPSTLDTAAPVLALVVPAAGVVVVLRPTQWSARKGLLIMSVLTNAVFQVV